MTVPLLQSSNKERFNNMNVFFLPLSDATTPPYAPSRRASLLPQPLAKIWALASPMPRNRSSLFVAADSEEQVDMPTPRGSRDSGNSAATLQNDSLGGSGGSRGSGCSNASGGGKRGRSGTLESIDKTHIQFQSAQAMFESGDAGTAPSGGASKSGNMKQSAATLALNHGGTAKAKAKKVKKSAVEARKVSGGRKVSGTRKVSGGRKVSGSGKASGYSIGSAGRKFRWSNAADAGGGVVTYKRQRRSGITISSSPEP